MCEARTRYGAGNFKWLLLVGDLANMYDELDHSGIDPASLEALKQYSSWVGRRSTSVRGLTINMVTMEVIDGKRYLDHDVYFSFEELFELSQFDNTHCWLQFRDQVFERRLGVPMGGLLSPHKANLVLGHREKWFLELLSLLGLTGGGIRFMDDVGLAIAYSTDDELRLARAWCDFVCGSMGYPHPLVLEMEPENSSYEYLEMIISTTGDQLRTCFHNKFVTNLNAGNCYFVRYPSGCDSMTQEERIQYVTAHLYRIFACTMTSEDLVGSLAELCIEVIASAWPMRLVKTALFKQLDHPTFGDEKYSEEMRSGIVKFLEAVNCMPWVV